MKSDHDPTLGAAVLRAKFTKNAWMPFLAVLLLIAFVLPACGGNESSGEVVQASCGNGVVEEGEECDNGSANSLDPSATCRPDCTRVACGDGIKGPGEECDEGPEILTASGSFLQGNSNDPKATCRPGCVKAGCGDGIRGTGEECDEGTANSNDPDATCRTNCKKRACGDGILDRDEECDEGGSNSDSENATCRINCTKPRCGDGIRDSLLGEACDDGPNNSDLPGAPCNTKCQIPGCGDGVLDTARGERCDNGDAEHGNGNSNTIALACRLDCQLPKCGDGVVDNGPAFNTFFSETCDYGIANNDRPGAEYGKVCRTNCMQARCGDGILDQGEGCDTGSLDNTLPLDETLGCSNSCSVISGFVCNGGGANACHKIQCGDGNVDANERCDEGKEIVEEGVWRAGNSVLPNAKCRPNCTLSRCGDGVLDDGEDCDTGDLNTMTLDGSKGCSAQCKVVEGWACSVENGTTTCRKMTCGDGILDESIGEYCDNGLSGTNKNTDNSISYESKEYCRTNCKPARCGDGIVDKNEQCDTGSFDSEVGEPTNTPGCTDCQIEEGWACTTENGVNSCHQITCGDGIIDNGEQCDNHTDHNSNAPGNYTTCRAPKGEFQGCVLARCGDGIVDVAAGEECDTGFLGNTEDLSYDTGCSKNCEIRKGWACSTNMDGINECHEIRCGDGIVDEGEECDKADGVNSNNSGRIGVTCRAPEGDFAGCVYAKCGDGIRDVGEECDLGIIGSNVAQDGSKGCSADCRIVPGWACVSSEDGRENSCHQITCGDGIKDGNEECDNGLDNGNTNDKECRTNCTRARCGDGIVSDGEECDTGTLDNTTGLDGSLGCSNKCKIIDGWACKNDDDGEAGPKSCHRITCGDGILDQGEDCDLGKNNSNSSGTIGQTCRAAQGTFAGCVYAKCGDGIVDIGEACDTGFLGNPREELDENKGCRADCFGALEGWTCSSTQGGPGSCHSNQCGDGVLDEGEEQCDNGENNSNNPSGSREICRTNCTKARCGDGIVDVAAGEQCDIGSLDNTELFDGSLGCTRNCKIVSGWACVTEDGINSCHPITCGDGILDQGEDCDLGEGKNSNEPGSACRENCKNAQCGDGIVDPGEECDTGLLNNPSAPSPSTGCNEQCKIVDGWACVTEDGRNSCHQITCGDGIPDRGEECDLGEYGNSNRPGAECRTNCKRARCGDGVLDEGEQCDTGTIENTNALDGSLGCSSSCQIVSGWGCVENQSGPDSCHRIVCGDGYKDSAEECDLGTEGLVINPTYIDRPLNTDLAGIVGSSCRTNCTIARCGDGIKDSGESCDTGSGISSTTLPDPRTGCSENCEVLEGWACDESGTSCHQIKCNDGIVDDGEQCDNGHVSNDPDAECRTNCTPQRCGDGIVDVASGEECDTGSLDNMEKLSVESGCSKDCKVAAGWACFTNEDNVNTCHEIVCGDEHQDGNEECDNGGRNSDGAGIVNSTCRSNCMLARCGDGILDDGEECDTGTFENQNPLDGSKGCEANCKVADGWACYLNESGPNSCHILDCGDGIKDDNEECDNGSDNGNTNDKECRTNCTRARCGDGIVNDNEECDTGTLDNTTGLDGSLGCSNKCKVEPGWACLNDEDGEAGPESCHRIVCGDGYADEGEECDFGTPGADILNPRYRDNPKNSDERGRYGSDDTATCRTNCTWARCGDGILDIGEVCDTATGIDNIEPMLEASGCDESCGISEGFACLPGESGPGSCHPINCGDGYKDGEEMCDEGSGSNSNDSNATCRTNCTPQRCGDGILDDGEECDTGILENTEKLDGSEGCSATCKVVNGWACVEGASGPGSCHEIICGDGYKDGNEDCDLGSTDVDILNPARIGKPGNSNDPGAECRLNCTEQRCGDGIVDVSLGEACDTGSINNSHELTGLDGCSSSCEVLPGWSCDTTEGVNSCHEIRCGDGHQDGDEECDRGSENSDIQADGCRTNCKNAFCGDGVQDSREICDDGDNSRRYKRSNDPETMTTAEEAYCLNCNARGPYCGDGQVESEFEECDNGNRNTNAPVNQLGTVCRTNCTLARCGDGILDVNLGEECDTGSLTTAALDGSRGCDENCKVVNGWRCDQGQSGPFSCHKAGCGDGIVDRDIGEECDEGDNNGDTAEAHCRSDCKLPYCGDGIVVTADGEICDDGVNAGGYTAYGLDKTCLNCTAWGPHCGDGQVTNGEVCDDGDNTYRHGSSASQKRCYRCTGWGPYCGDGNVSNGEQCDKGSANSNSPNALCRLDCTTRRCGDGIVDPNYGELCDDGINDGSYGHCRRDCTALARGCGDGVVEGGERCDEGLLNGLIGHCNESCTGMTTASCGDGVINNGEACDNGVNNGFGPGANCREDCTRVTCGDGILDGNEECDLGTGQNNGSLCTSTCRRSSTAPRCGDGIQDPGEACDRGSNNRNSGTATCNTSCGYRWQSSTQEMTFNDRLTSSSSTWNRSCTMGSGSYRYNVYAIQNVSGSAQTVDILSNQTCDGYLHVYRGSYPTNGSVCVDYNDDYINTRHSRLTDIRMDANQTIYIVTSTYSSGITSCNSTVRVVRTGCGNGIRSNGEGCDDGNLVNGDGCNSNCQVASGATCSVTCNNGTCTDNCQTRLCGNGIKETGEECDDGNRTNGDGCSSECAIESGFVCQSATFSYSNNGVTKSTSGSHCYRPRCGDGMKSSTEECDDGNAVNNDGCDNDCQISSIGECRMVSSTQTVTPVNNVTNLIKSYTRTYSDCDVCGNGQLKYGMEQCDDGNRINGDGCNSSCTIEIEDNWICSVLSPSKCATPATNSGILANNVSSPRTFSISGSNPVLSVSGLTVAGASNAQVAGTSAYFYGKNGCTASSCTPYPYTTLLIKNTGSTATFTIEAKFDSVDGWLEVYKAPFVPHSSSRLAYNDDGHTACYTTYSGIKHSCLRYTLAENETYTLVLTTYSTRTTGAGNVTVKIYK